MPDANRLLGENLLDYFNNRELATLIWLVVIFVFVLAKPKIRFGIGSVIKAAFAKQLSIFYALMLAYMAAVVYLLRLVGLWNVDDLKLTILWLLGSGFGMFFRYLQEKDHGFIHRVLEDQITLIVILEFVVNLYSFPLWIELSMIPFAVVVTALIAVSEGNEEYRVVEKLMTAILVAYGLLVITFTLVGVFSNWDQYVTLTSYWEFLLPIVLTVAFLPLIYLFAVYVAYEGVFLKLNFILENKGLIPYTKKRLIRKFGLNLNLIGRWSKKMNSNWLANEVEIDAAISEFKDKNS